MNLAEINRERQEIIEKGVEAILKKVESGRIYTAEELSVMSGGLIPAKNVQTSLRRALHKVETHRYAYHRNNEYYLFSGIRIRPVKDSRTLTYKVYDENGELIDEFTRHKGIVKAMRP